MRSVYIYTLILPLILIPACNNSRAMANGMQTEITFGRTGGFTNIPVEYMINSNGDVLRLYLNNPGS